MKNNQKRPFHQGAKGFLFKRAKELRREATTAEVALWQQLRARSFLNLKFRQQHPIGRYIADFYCHELKLVVEVDGGYHLLKEQQQKDAVRDKVMQDNGLHVLRLTNDEVLEDIALALEKIKEIVQEIKDEV